MSKSQKNSVRLIVATAILFTLCIAVSPYANGITKILLFFIPYITIGAKVFYKSFIRLKNKDFLDENFLMTIASLGAFILGEYVEGVAVLLFYAVGQLFESMAVGKSRKSISELMDISPEYANVERDGNIVTVAPSEVKVGDVIVIKPGERVPLDGIVKDGASTLDTTSLTGESKPQKAGVGDNIFSGCINISGVLKVKVTKGYCDSTVAKILELVESSALAKSKSENFISKFAKYYTPIVVGVAVLIAFVPPLFAGELARWIAKALIFLVVSCPCALVISVPLTFFAGIGASSKAGILIKGSTYIERLANTGTVVFDKTGTLTKGTFEVVQVNCKGMEQAQLLELAAKVEIFSDHPIALSIKNAYKNAIDTSDVTGVTEIAGCGISAYVNGDQILAGNQKLMDKYAVPYEINNSGTVVYIAKNGVYKGNIVISDTVKSKAKSAICMLKQNGVQKTVMLTGDKKDVAQKIAEQIGIDEYKSDLFPHDKVEQLQKYIKSSKKTVVFAGDGINDAPVLTRADVGIAMGAIGSDSAIEAADVVLMDDNLQKIPLAIKLSKKVMAIVRQNIVFSIAIKMLVMVLSVFGYANMWVAVFADVGVSVIAILNAMRALKIKG